MTAHRHRWHVEQQTNHRFCEMCGHHDPPVAGCPDRPSALWAYLMADARRKAADDHARIRALWGPAE